MGFTRPKRRYVSLGKVGIGHIDLAIDRVHRPGDLRAFEVFLLKQDSDTRRVLEAGAIEDQRGPQIAPDVQPTEVDGSLWTGRLPHFTRIPVKQITLPRLRIRNSVRVEFRWGESVEIIMGIHEDRDSHLPKVVQAAYLLAFLFSARQRRKKQGRKNSYDGDDDQ